MRRKNCKKIPKHLVKNMAEYGLKLCHCPTKVKVLKLSWIKRDDAATHMQKGKFCINVFTTVIILT